MPRERIGFINNPPIPVPSWPLKRGIITVNELQTIYIPFYGAPWQIAQRSPKIYEISGTKSPKDIEPESIFIAMVSCPSEADVNNLRDRIKLINHDALCLQTKGHSTKPIALERRELKKHPTCDISLQEINEPSLPRLQVIDSNGKCLFTDHNPDDVQTSHVAAINHKLGQLWNDSPASEEQKKDTIKREAQLRAERDRILEILRGQRENMLKAAIETHNLLVRTFFTTTNHVF